ESGSGLTQLYVYVTCDASGRVPVESIAGRTDGADQVCLTTIVDRLPEAPDMDVHGANLDVAVMPPDRVQQPLTREDAARMLQEVTQQAEFGRAERYRLAAAPDAVSGGVHLD